MSDGFPWRLLIDMPITLPVWAGGWPIAVIWNVSSHAAAYDRPVAFLAGLVEGLLGGGLCLQGLHAQKTGEADSAPSRTEAATADPASEGSPGRMDRMREAVQDTGDGLGRVANATREELKQVESRPRRGVDSAVDGTRALAESGAENAQEGTDKALDAIRERARAGLESAQEACDSIQGRLRPDNASRPSRHAPEPDPSDGS
jgi:hypothetical protein